MLITERYRKLNKDLHAGGVYGLHGDKWVEIIRVLIRRFQPATLLDYGCGQGSLARALDQPIAEYDPAIDGKQDLPMPSDLVVCTDVIEHVEPELIDSVLDHLHSVTKKCLFLVIATRPATKFLADGRNAHLIVEPWEWWESKLLLRFNVIQEDIDPAEARLILTPISQLNAFYRRGLKWFRAVRPR